MSDLVHFKKRIGNNGIEQIFKKSVEIQGKDSQGEKLSAIDPIVEHTKSDYQMARYFVKDLGEMNEMCFWKLLGSILRDGYESHFLAQIFIRILEIHKRYTGANSFF